MFFILITGILCFFLCVAGCTENPTQEPTTGIVTPTANPTEEPTQLSTEETTVSTPEPTSESTSKKQTYDLELEVTKTEKRESAGEFIPYPGKIFVIMVFKITNHGDIPYNFGPDLVLVEDENGDKWGFVESATFQGGVLITPFRGMTIEPGNSAGGGIVFSVPQSTETYSLLLYDDKGNIVAKTVIGTIAEQTSLVQADDLELEVIKAGKRESANGFNPYPGKIFLIVSFRIKNHGDTPYDYSATYVWVEDENKDTWGFVEDATFQSGVLNTPFSGRTIEPGTYDAGGLIFSVPQSTETYNLLLYDEKKHVIVAKTTIGTVLG